MKFIHLEHDSVNFNNNTPVFYQQRRITRDTPCFTPASLSDILYNFYRPPTKLGEGIIFTGICHSVQGVPGVPGHFWGGGNAWFRVPFWGSVCLAWSQVLFWGWGGYARYIPDTPPCPWKVHPIWRVHHLVLTSSGGQRSAR